MLGNGCIICEIMNLLFLESQPNFPQEDLTDSNAQILDILLSDPSAHAEHHQVAEQGSFLYRFGHPALVSRVASSFFEREMIHVYEYGIEAYEAIASLATLRFNRPGHSYEETKLYFSTPQRLTDTATMLDDQIDEFEATMPNTSHVIESITKRSNAALAHYAIAGAAMAYTLEKAVIDRPDIMLMRAIDE